MRIRRLSAVGVILLGSILIGGCDSKIDHFEPNRVFALTLSHSRGVPTGAALSATDEVIEELFGTPDQPRWPTDWLGPDASRLVDPENLARAAGPFSSNRDGTHQGLYREHCVTCHALSGSGAGPASLMQDPYPRDFRHGVFKWKRTERSAKPTRDDLIELLRRGVRGTAMPSFALIDQEDQNALVDYLIYLSVRGESERRLMSAALELGYEDVPPRESQWRLAADGTSEGAAVVRETVDQVVQSWLDAEHRKVEVPEFEQLSGTELEASIQRGRDIFHGQVANCAGCHGPNGNGQTNTLDFDDWTKEYSTLLGLTPNDREAMRPFRQAGALKPRPIDPRNLQDGVFRGGGDPETLYCRITQGIAGTPMPAVLRLEDDVDPHEAWKGLTDDQIWDLVRYVRSFATVKNIDG